MQTGKLPRKKGPDRKMDQYPVLIAQQGPLEGMRWNINQELIIGRDPGCDVIIEDRQVSRQHARLFCNENNVEIQDLDSKNGTFLLGEQLSGKAILNDGTIIQIALVQKFVFFMTDATMPLEDVSVFQNEKTNTLLLDKKSHRVWIGMKEVTPPLSVQQFRLLEVLSERPGIVLTRNELIDWIWGKDQSAGVSDQALDALIRRLRERLGEIDSRHSYIVTIRGHGLRFDNN